MPTSIPGLQQVTTLTFDIFGTVLDLTGSMTPPSRRFLERKGATVSADRFWDQWRARQRIEQYQDSLMQLGHAGYLETCRRALVYCLRLNGIAFTDDEVRELMQAWQRLIPHPDVAEGLRRLGTALQAGRPVERRADLPRAPRTGANALRLRCGHLGAARGRLQAASRRVPRGRDGARRGAAPAPDGRSALLRHHGSAGLRLSRRVREPLPAARTKSRRTGPISR